MPFGHEKLDVYRLSIDYVGWVYRLCQSLKGQQANAKDQILRASQSIPLNIAEGNGKATTNDRRRYFEIARGSALECAAAQDVLEICGALEASENSQAKQTLDRIVAMLTKLGQRGYSVQEDAAEYEINESDAECDADAETDADCDADCDSDSDEDPDADLKPS